MYVKTNFLIDLNSRTKILSILEYIALALVLILFSFNGVAFAQDTKDVNLETLDPALNKGLMLKYVRAFREVPFTRPQSWQILPGSNITVKFNHSTELIPERSYLNIYINGKLVKHESLDKTSLNTKTITVPIPLAGLGNYNKIRFEVEQHYIDVCEDPLDPSLWTSIKADSYIHFVYNRVQPKLDLSKFPYPLFDPFTYDINRVNFIAPKLTTDSSKSLTALGIICADIAQKISWHKQEFIASSPTNQINNTINNIIIGTPVENPAIGKLNNSIGNSIKNINGRLSVTDKSGNALADNTGVIYYFNNPSNPHRAILIITGNSPDGVLLAARYLANDSLVEKLKGNTAIVNNYNPPRDKTNNIARYVVNDNRTFKQLGFEDRKAIRIGSPPLEYPIRIVPNLSTTKTPLALNIIYSYGPDVNVELSSIEVRFNGYPLKGETLENSKGEKNESLRVEVPYQYVKTYNELQVKFHLFPSKFGYCVDDYVDNNWGIVSNESSVIIPGDAKIISPDLGLLNDIYYPYSYSQDLSDTAVILPDTPSVDDYNAAVKIIGAIANITNSDGGVNLATTTANKTFDMGLADRNLILIGTIANNSMISEAKNNLFLIFEDYFTIFKPYKEKVATLAYNNNQGIIEQLVSSLAKNKLTTIIYGKTASAMTLAANAFSNKDFLVKIIKGNLFVADANNIKPVIVTDEADVKRKEASRTYTVTTQKSDSQDTSGLIALWVMGLVAVLVVIFIVKVVFDALFSRKG